MSTQVVSSGAVGGTFAAGQTLDVVSSGFGGGVVLDAGAVASTYDGGVMYGTDVEGGTIFIGANGETNGDQVHAGSEVVLADGDALSTTVFAGGSSVISAGGSAYDTVLASGQQYVLGSAGGTVLYVDATQIVGSGGTIEGTGVGEGSVVIVQPGGIASDVTIGNPAAPDVALITVPAGVAGKELLVVLSGGSASGTQLGANGLLVVLAGGSATATNSAGGTSISGNAVVLETAAGPTGEGNTADGISVAAYQSLLVFAGGVASATTVADLGNLTVFAGGTASDTTISGGTETVASGGSATGFIDFASPGRLVLSGTAMPGGTISGFAVGDTIDLAGIALTSAGVPAFDSATGLLTVAEGGSDYTLTFDRAHDSYAGEAFSAGDDGTGDTEIKLFTCFCAGTRIAVPGGTVAVEKLRPGNLVSLADGSAQPVRWLGQQRVSRRFADPIRALPVRIRADALGGGLPVRDLLLSPGHALRLDGLLVNAGALVGLPGIAREAAMPDFFAYWHVELDAHALLLAEGVAAESYFDSIEPVAFDNVAERPPCEAAREMPLPRVKSARQLPAALRARLRMCAAA